MPFETFLNWLTLISIVSCVGSWLLLRAQKKKG